MSVCIHGAKVRKENVICRFPPPIYCHSIIGKVRLLLGIVGMSKDMIRLDAGQFMRLTCVKIFDESQLLPKDQGKKGVFFCLRPETALTLQAQNETNGTSSG